MQRFISHVKQTIIEHRMLQPGDSVLVGVSGGPDSTALLQVLRVLAFDFSIQLGVAHLNHGLRGSQADSDALLVEEMANQCQLPCFLRKVDIKEQQRAQKRSLEETGRDVRYAFLAEIAETHHYTKIALAHHLDDNAESILMFLLRGSGLGGLSGIPPIRNKMYIRPFIAVTKQQIHHFLKQSRSRYVIDESNQDTRLLRNRIRHCLIPTLQADYNPKIVTTLNRLGKICRQEEEWMTAMVAPLFRSTLLEADHKRLRLSLTTLNALPVAVQRRILRLSIGQIKGDLKRIQLHHIDILLEHIDKQSHGLIKRRRFDLPDQIQVMMKNDTLTIAQKAMPLRLAARDEMSTQPFMNFEYTLSALDNKPVQICIPEIKAGLTFRRVSPPVTQTELQAPHCAYFDLDILSFPLAIRNPRPGDRFRPLGMQGSQKLKAFFINNKIDADKRKRIPLLLSDQKIIWIAGYRLSESVKITSTTKNILKVEICLHSLHNV